MKDAGTFLALNPEPGLDAASIQVQTSQGFRGCFGFVFQEMRLRFLPEEVISYSLVLFALTLLLKQTQTQVIRLAQRDHGQKQRQCKKSTSAASLSHSSTSEFFPLL